MSEHNKRSTAHHDKRKYVFRRVKVREDNKERAEKCKARSNPI